jgi:hypothetical protein
MKAHWSFEWINDDFLGKYSRPEGTITESGKNTFVFRRFNHEKNTKWEKMGPALLTINCEKALESERMIAVNWKTQIMEREGVQTTDAKMKCNDDDVFSLKSWSVNTRARDNNGKELGYMDYNEEGVIDNAMMKRQSPNLTPETQQITPRLTSNWSLISALPMLMRKQTKKITFSMFEDLVCMRSDQSIIDAGSTQIKLNDKELKLNGFCQTGEGVMPTHYWFDEEYRPLFMINSQCHFYALFEIR